VTQFLVGNAISAIDHLLNSPDLTPADFWLFPELRKVLKGSLSDFDDMNSSVTKILIDIPVQGFRNCFE
jgi:hypothetical protein